MTSLCLGLDASTQSLTAVVLELDEGSGSGEIVLERSLRYDQELPHWGTRDGQLESDDPQLGQAPPLMWVEALDHLMARLRDSVGLAAVRALAVAAQQHGSVYLNGKAPTCLEARDPQRSLAELLAPALARPVSPLWTDSSTSVQCREIRNALGGSDAAAALTGSDIYERFTGPQIRRFAQHEPERWAQTRHVALVSSFLTSVLVGRPAPLDWGDAAGTNLFDLRQRCWAPSALDATAEGLRGKLPELAPPDRIVGRISSYFVERYGFDPQTEIVIGTGDNSSSALGVGLQRHGDAMLSLGTSDTLSGLGEELAPLPGGHLFVAPTRHDLGLLCFRNGSLARQEVRDRFGVDWAGFDSAVADAPLGNGGHLLLPWSAPEIVPRTIGTGFVLSPGFPRDDAAHYCRAILEGQAMAMLRHSGPLRPFDRLRVTGGGSASDAMLQIVADLFGCSVERTATSSGAAVGAALRAAVAACASSPVKGAWPRLVELISEPQAGSKRLPRDDARSAYAALVVRHGELERAALEQRAAPA